MGASNIGYLLSSLCYSGSFDASKRDAFIDLPCSEFYAYHHSLELVIKPIAVLLEDQRSKASCERNIKAFLSLIDCSRFRSALSSVRAISKPFFQGEIFVELE